MTPLRRVRVTGLAALTAAGGTPAALWEAVVAGRPLVRAFEGDPRWCVGALPADLALDVPPAVRRDLDRSGVLLYAAARRAWADAGLDGLPLGDASRAGLVAASSAGAVAAILDAHARWMGGEPAAPRDVLRGATGLAGAVAADHLGLLGPALHLAGGSAAGVSAIGEAWLEVASGQLDRCVAVAAEAPLHRAVLAQFGAARLLAEGGPEACRPFEIGRHGTQLGEAAVALVLEGEDEAAARGAPHRGRVAGYGAAGDGAHQVIAPHPEGAGLARAVRAALTSAGVAPGAVDLVMLHGTGTVLNDASEARAFAAAYGGAMPAAAATKPITGHCLGAAGTVEAVIALLALERGVAPPTPNLDAPDPALAVPVDRRARSIGLRVACVHASGFGGRNAAVVLVREGQ